MGGRAKSRAPATSRAPRHGDRPAPSGSSSTSERLIELQGQAGNRAVTGLLGAASSPAGLGVPVQRKASKLPEEDLVAPRYASNVRLQKAFDNNKAIKAFEPDRKAVRLVQQGLVDDHFPLPKSTKNGTLDGVYGQETVAAVTAFQRKHALTHKDGACGRETLRRLDELALGGGVGPGSSQNERKRALALATLAAEQKRIYGLIAKGLKLTPGGSSPDRRDVLFRNACEWIAQGKSKLTVLVETHDSKIRATKPGAQTKPGDLVSYIDKSVRYPTVGGDYPLEPAAGEEAHVAYVPVGFLGSNSLDNIQLVGTESKDEETLVTTLIHEVQHAADGSGSQGRGWVEIVDAKGKRDLATEGIVNDYQSEFRAHWIEFPEGDANDKYGSSTAPASNATPLTYVDTDGTTHSQPTSFKNQRQERVFFDLLSNNYPYRRPYVTNAEFRRRVDAYDAPAGVNLLDSVRVDNLLDALSACNTNMAEKHPKIVQAMASADALDAADRRFLRDTRLAEPFWQHARKHLNGTQLSRLREKAGFPPGK